MDGHRSTRGHEDGGHGDYHTTANICTHLKEDSLKKAAADMATVFKKKKDAKQVKKAVDINAHR